MWLGSQRLSSALMGSSKKKKGGGSSGALIAGGSANYLAAGGGSSDERGASSGSGSESDGLGPRGAGGAAGGGNGDEKSDGTGTDTDGEDDADGAHGTSGGASSGDGGASGDDGRGDEDDFAPALTEAEQKAAETTARATSDAAKLLDDEGYQLDSPSKAARRAAKKKVRRVDEHQARRLRRRNAYPTLPGFAGKPESRLREQVRRACAQQPKQAVGASSDLRERLASAARHKDTIAAARAGCSAERVGASGVFGAVRVLCRKDEFASYIVISRFLAYEREPHQLRGSPRTERPTPARAGRRALARRARAAERRLPAHVLGAGGQLLRAPQHGEPGDVVVRREARRELLERQVGAHLGAAHGPASAHARGARVRGDGRHVLRGRLAARQARRRVVERRVCVCVCVRGVDRRAPRPSSPVSRAFAASTAARRVVVLARRPN